MNKNTANVISLDTLFFGLDVHKKTITIALAEIHGEPTYVKTIPNTAHAIKRFFTPYLASGRPIRVVYEAGGCGYTIARQLGNMGIHVIVAAPSKIHKVSGEVKNDKRDAIKLAKLLRCHILMGQQELHPVHVPEIEDEALRDKTRQRHAFKKKIKATKAQITAMVLRYGGHYDLTIKQWTVTHRKWLDRLDFKNQFLQDIFREYLDTLAEEEARLERCERALGEMCEAWNRAEVVKGLCTLKGIKEISAISIVAEVGCFSRFDSATSFMAYLGLTPSEHSSGEKVTRGRITKAGNKRARTLFIEAACAARYKPKSKASFAQTCPEGLPPEIIDHAYKAQIRMHKKYWRLVNKGKNANAARTAVARELAGFVWWIAVAMETLAEATEEAAA
jgi:transposase